MDRNYEKQSASVELVCPKCGSRNVETQLYQEETSAKAITKTTSKYKQKGHGIIWWICIGSWWWIVDLMLWLCFFPIKLVLAITKKKKYVGKGTSVTSTARDVTYRTVCLCKNCGYNWKK